MKLETRTALDSSRMYSGIRVYSHITSARFTFKETVPNSDNEQQFNGIIEEEPSMADFVMHFFIFTVENKKVMKSFMRMGLNQKTIFQLSLRLTWPKLKKYHCFVKSSGRLDVVSGKIDGIFPS